MGEVLTVFVEDVETDEHDVGLHFKRMTVLSALFGDEEFHANRVATLPSFTAEP